MAFLYTLGVNNDKSRYNNLNEDTIHFDNAIYSVFHVRSNITASFAELLKFQEQLTFTHGLSVTSGK